MAVCTEWLFQTFEKEQDRCQCECLKMVETMRKMIPHKSLFEAWEFAGTTLEWSI
jgi:hypothetical protein